MYKRIAIRELIPIYGILLVNILSGGLSILPLYFIYDNTAAIDLMAGALNVIWLFFHIGKKTIFPKLPIFIISFLGIIYFQLLTGWLNYSLVVLFLQTTFLLVLIGLYQKYKVFAIKIITDVYLAYSLANVVCTIIGVSLILSGFLDLTSNPLDLNTFTKSDDLAFFPDYLTVIRPKDIVRVGFIPIEGMICGFSHEPHVVGYFCIPALFLWIARLKSLRRIVVIILYTIFVLLTLSTTSLIFVSLVFTVAVILRPDQFGRYKFLTFTLLGLVFLGILLNQSFFISNFSFFFDKITDREDTMGGTNNFILFALTPKTIIGTNIYEFTGESLTGDIGVPSAILNLLFYISSFTYSIKMILNRNNYVFWTGLSFLYFMLHSLKGMLQIYQFPYALMMLFISFIVYTYKKNNIESVFNTPKS